ncbi:MAG TPA: hypothetical protein PKC43_09260 [Phycisphaerales bacterium]|nr:hypothetical protein [Phycisphaerales bacterium]HMP37623.1 hypothetical protein [Phycisphaerales bacterium]
MRRNHRAPSLALIPLASALLWASAGVASTNVAGPVLTNTTWTAASSPYVVTGSIVIGFGATLTIEPGVTVRINAGLGIQVGSPGAFGAGALVAIGTAAAPILFTSSNSPNAGAWNSIDFTTESIDAQFDQVTGGWIGGSTLQHCIVELAGSGGPATGAVTIQESTPYIASSTIRQSARSGIRATLQANQRLRIDGCIIRLCAHAGEGGGLWLSGGTGHRIASSLFELNLADLGGGVWLSNAAQVEFIGNVVRENTAGSSFASGGGVYGSGLSGLAFLDNVIRDNAAGSGGSLGGAGGAYLNAPQGTIANSTFEGNLGARAGGLYIDSAGTTIAGCHFVDNSVAAEAGALWVGSSAVSIIDSVFSDNVAGTRGGALYGPASDGVISGNVFAGNRALAEGGGAIAFQFSGGHAVSFNDFLANETGGDGGAIWVPSVSATNITCSGNDFIGNSALRGGAICNRAKGLTLSGTPQSFNRMLGNQATAGAAIYHDVPNGADGNLPAANVCWGTTDQAQIQAMNWDFFDDANLGIIISIPVIAECSDAGAPGDLNGDGVVDGADLGLLLGAWGGCASCPNCPADLNGDCAVNGADLGLLLGNWG